MIYLVLPQLLGFGIVLFLESDTSIPCLHIGILWAQMALIEIVVALLLKCAYVHPGMDSISAVVYSLKLLKKTSPSLCWQYDTTEG